MRIFRLASLVVAPVVVALVVAPANAAAVPAGAAAKRLAKRPVTSASAAAPRPLPAPLPKNDVLPPLPPVARDATSIATLTSAPVPEVPESLPAVVPVEAPPALAAVPVNRDVVTVPSDAAREVKPSGWILQLGSGVLAPTSSFVAGVRTFGPGALFDLELGYYATPHFGMLVGVRASYGHTIPGCGSSCDGGFSYQVPVMFQLAAQDRTRGIYVGFGVGLGTTYGGNVGHAATYTMSSPLEAKLLLGYRLGLARGARSATAVDLNLGTDIGSMDTLEVTTEDGSASEKCDAPPHVVVALSALLHFSL